LKQFGAVFSGGANDIFGTEGFALKHQSS